MTWRRKVQVGLYVHSSVLRLQDLAGSAERQFASVSGAQTASAAISSCGEAAPAWRR